MLNCELTCENNLQTEYDYIVDFENANQNRSTISSFVKVREKLGIAKHRFVIPDVTAVFIYVNFICVLSDILICGVEFANGIVPC